MRHGNRRRASASGAPRLTEWIAATVGWTDFTASELSQLIIFNQAALAPLVPFTIVRTVGVFNIAFDRNFITNQTYSGAVGGAVISDRGQTTVQRPFTDASDDLWFWHQFFAGQIDDRADSDLVVSRAIVIDSKAQRKVEDGMAIQFGCEGGGEADGFDASLQLRILCKLH